MSCIISGNFKEDMRGTWAIYDGNWFMIDIITDGLPKLINLYKYFATRPTTMIIFYTGKDCFELDWVRIEGHNITEDDVEKLTEMLSKLSSYVS